MEGFEGMALRSELLRAVQDMGFTIPTTIQEQAIPILLQQTTDFVGLAQTGTGKTAAFGLPLLEHCDSGQRSVQALVMSPTRELCMQITADMVEFAKYLPKVKVEAVYGGTSISTQIREIRQGVHIVVATPGRLIDLIERRAIDLATVKFVVLDEADEMLNMGFRDDIEFILQKTTGRLSTWMFSATMPSEVRSIANRYMKDPKEVTVGSKNMAADNITHEYYITHSQNRYEALKRLIDVHPEMYGLIFTRTKADAQDIAERLIREGYDIDALHGDLSQAQRDKVMARFREKSLQLLIATDVAARGIDVEGITHVINYALPDEPEVYTHRSGRTARAGRSGICISLLHARETGRLRDIERVARVKIARREIPGGQEVCDRQLIHFFEKLHNAASGNAGYEQYLPEISKMFADFTKEEILSRMASLELNHFMEYYKNAPDLNVRPHEISDRPASLSRSGAPDSGKVTLYLNIGTKDGFHKANFMEFILEGSDLSKDVVGRISLNETFSHVEVEPAAATKIAQTLNGKNYQGRDLRVNVATQGGGGRRPSGTGYQGRSERSERSPRPERTDRPGR
ncbi:MAG TPA: DEAD/DEAH box helicase, partial [Chitinophagaceae bacterium]|nr:DEAD/DEAH box helicase [Chitinophagaceae bacterium]